MVVRVHTFIGEIMLFGIFKYKVKKNLLIQDIDLFLLTRRSLLTAKAHKEWLYKFADSIGVDTPEALKDSDYSSFLESLKWSENTNFQRSVATTAICLYKAWRDRTNKPRRPVGRPQNKDRNFELYQLRLESPRIWTFRKLSEKYNLDVKNVFQIVKRFEQKELDK